jgi:hypothetical protein
MIARDIALITALGCCAPFGAEASSVFVEPRPLATGVLLRHRFPQAYLHFLSDRIFPIGWSRRGTLVFGIEPADEASGCYEVSILVQDLRSDSKESIDNYQSCTPERTQAGAGWPSELFTGAWPKRLASMQRRLTELSVEAPREWTLHNFPLSRDNGDQIDIAVVKHKDEEDFVTSVELQLHSKLSGMKVIYRAGETAARLIDVQALAFLRSPFEDRIAVLIASIYRGYEGPPNVARLSFVGAHLVDGFERGALPARDAGR